MSVFDRVQPYISTEDGKFFDISFCTDDVSFKIIELTFEEVRELLNDVLVQLSLLQEAYQSSTPTARQEEKE